MKGGESRVPLTFFKECVFVKKHLESFPDCFAHSYIHIAVEVTMSMDEYTTSSCQL